ncbi:MAG TPA: XdhC family protein [Thermoanaerobaculia bacterium]|nr:XdhC family protein [Thermoanaerobaculia bacterium]
MSDFRRIVELRREWISSGRRAILAHLVSVDGSHYRRPGARMLLSEEGESFGSVSGGCLDADLRRRIPEVLPNGEPIVVRYDTGSRDDVLFGSGLGCGGKIEILVTPLGNFREGPDALEAAAGERDGGTLATVVRSSTPGLRPGDQTFFSRDGRVVGGSDRMRSEIPATLRTAWATVTSRFLSLSGGADVLLESVVPPFTLFLAGSGDDLAALARLAAPLGWQVEAVVPRATALAERRFENLLAGPMLTVGDVASRATARSGIVVATHNYLDDLEVLRASLPTPAAYIGLLGSRDRVSRLTADAGDVGGDRARLHGPAGLDIGAETPEEIAVSIVAEIQGVLSGRSGGSLRARRSATHDRADSGAANSSGALAPGEPR